MKCLISGDPGLPSEYIYNEMKKLEKYGVTFTCIDWKKSLALKRFYSMIMKIEREGPEKAEPFEEMLNQIADTEILIVHFTPISSQVIERGEKLKIIGCARGGYENVNVKVAKKKGIVVIHAPGRNAGAVADLTIGLILALVRKIVKLHCLLKKGVWESFNSEKLPYDLNGKVLGIIGFGHVGREVAKRAKAFGMKILAYDAYVKKEVISKFGAKSIDLNTLLKNSDIVSLHVRLTPETYHMMGEREFKLMKRTALFVNTARGRITDESALIKALENRWIAGAALDVFEEEPIRSDCPILRFENVVVTPHTAGLTRQSLLINGPRIITDQIESLLKGGETSYSL